jgi:hypothetical protein
VRARRGCARRAAGRRFQGRLLAGVLLSLVVPSPLRAKELQSLRGHAPRRMFCPPHRAHRRRLGPLQGVHRWRFPPPPRFLDPEEIIHLNLPTLRYRVFIDIFGIEDWHLPSSSSSTPSADSDSGGDGQPAPPSSSWFHRSSFPAPQGDGDVQGPNNGGGQAPNDGDAPGRHRMASWWGTCMCLCCPR